MADFEEHRDDIESRGAWIVAASSDPQEAAAEAVQEWDLDFPVLYGLDAHETSDAIGCYTGERRGTPHIQPASFIVGPEGTVEYAVYSSGKAGRLTAQDALDVLPEEEEGA